MMVEHWNGGSGGKGSKPRPFSVSQTEFDNRWDLIFKKDKSKAEELDIPVLENEETWAQRVIDEEDEDAGKS
jgi:hypothetical protein